MKTETNSTTTKQKRPYTKRAYNKKVAIVTKNISSDALDAITYLNNLTVAERAKVISLFN